MSASNNVTIMGRFTRDPELRYSNGNNSMATTKFSLAVDRKGAKEGGQTADFINCVAFGKTAEFIGNYFKKGSKALIRGHIITGQYQNKDGQTVYTTEVGVDEIDFAESKNASQSNGNISTPNFGTPTANDLPIANNGFQPVGIDVPSFVNVPSDGDLPFAPPTR